MVERSDAVAAVKTRVADLEAETVGVLSPDCYIVTGSWVLD